MAATSWGVVPVPQAVHVNSLAQRPPMVIHPSRSVAELRGPEAGGGAAYRFTLGDDRRSKSTWDTNDFPASARSEVGEAQTRASPALV
jgi:hypothetical protein